MFNPRHYIHYIRRGLYKFYFNSYRIFFGLPEGSLDEIAPGARAYEVNGIILDEICMPPYYGPKDHDDITPLLQLVKTLRPATILEFGTAHGNTTANLCKLTANATVYTVNALSHQQSGGYTTFSLDKEQVGGVYREYGYSDRVRQIYENTLNLDLSAYLKSPCIDLAIIDACHDTDYVLNDFFKVEPYVGQGGVVLFHDTALDDFQHLEGSYLACMRLRRKGYNVMHLPETWWAYWIKP